MYSWYRLLASGRVVQHSVTGISTESLKTYLPQGVWMVSSVFPAAAEVGCGCYAWRTAFCHQAGQEFVVLSGAGRW